MGNRIQCKKCLDIIESRHRHDFVTCGCGKVSIDGGSDYQKVSFPNLPVEDWIEFDETKFSGGHT